MPHRTFSDAARDPDPGHGNNMQLMRSIQAKITLGVVALLILMTIATAAVVLDRSQAALREQVVDAHESRAALITNTLDEGIAQVRELALLTAQQEPLRTPLGADAFDENGTVPPDGAASQRALLEHARGATPFVAAAVITDPNGNVALAQPYEVQTAFAELGDDAPAILALNALALAAQTGDGTVVRAGPVAGTWSTAVPLTTDSRQIWGILVLIGESEALVATMSSVARAETSLFLVDADGTVIAGTVPLEDPDLGDAATAGAARLAIIAGREHLTTAAPLSTTDWRVVVATDTAIAFARADALVRSVLLVAGVIVLVGLAVAVLLAQSLSAPVVRLRRAAERVAAGGYGTQVRVSTRDELADLTAAFNTMSTRLLEEQQRLRHQHETLEATVQDRTRELAEKNDELEAFAYAASHDLRTPVIALDWLLQEAREQLEQGVPLAEIEATFARMDANIAGMDRLIGDLLELSRVGRTEGEPGPVPILPVVERVLERVAAHQKERGTEIHVDVADEVVVVADPRRMEQLFVNVLTNAIKYGRPGGNVWVRATPIGAPTRPWKWRLEVADDGPGVPEEQREEIFMLFRRGAAAVDSPTDGTGIGLALTRKIVRAYGGEIKVTSAQEGGALFWFTLTAARPAGRAAAWENPKAEPHDDAAKVGDTEWPTTASRTTPRRESFPGPTTTGPSNLL